MPVCRTNTATWNLQTDLVCNALLISDLGILLSLPSSARLTNAESAPVHFFDTSGHYPGTSFWKYCFASCCYGQCLLAFAVVKVWLARVYVWQAV